MKATFYALAGAAFISGANMRLFDSLLPTIADDFAVAPTVASVVVTSFTLAYGLFQIVHGPLGDRVGRLRTVAIAMFIACLGSLGSAIAPTLPELTMLRFITGIGAAGIIPVAMAWIGDHSTYENRQATLGRFIGFTLTGQIVGPALGGALAEWLSWRDVFYLFAAAFLCVSLALLKLDHDERKQAASSEDGPRPMRSSKNVLHTYLEILRAPWARIVLLTVFIEGMLFYGTFAYTGAWLKETFDLPYFIIGATLAGFGLGGVFYSFSVRWLLRRLREPAFVLGGALVLLVFYLCLPFSPVWHVVAPLCVASGFGFYMLHNTLQTKATEMYPAARGTAVCVFALSLFLGQAMGVALFGRTIASFGYTLNFVATGFALLLLAIWFARKLRHHPP
ncbi:MAG: MFS transporter [Betaproteobacteria bacterium]|nr:MAG: MFS transporter [Betaproteobacteria bacterium]